MNIGEKIHAFLLGSKGYTQEMRDQPFQIYRCKKCGYITSAEPEGAIGTIQAHAEKHTGFLSFGNFQKLNQFIEKLEVTEFEEVARVE